ncbi:MAG: hypothetical protein ACRENP_08740, partial [Longimicrobiales bacterium]
PLNLIGLVTPDARVPAITRNRVLFRDGVALAALEARQLRRLTDCELTEETLRALLARRPALASLQAHMHSPAARERWLARARRVNTTPETAHSIESS